MMDDVGFSLLLDNFSCVIHLSDTTVMLQSQVSTNQIICPKPIRKQQK
jgi:hypothetical protein